MVVVRSAPCRGGAERPRPVRRIHRRRLRQREQSAHRRVLCPGQRLRLLRAGQVGAGGRAGQQRPPGEHPQHPPAVEQQVREMLSGMAGRHPGPQRQAAQIHLIPVRQPPVTEGTSPGRGREDLRAVVGGQLHRPGQEVGVQVRVGGERDRQPVPAAARTARRSRGTSTASARRPPGRPGRPNSPGPHPRRARSVVRPQPAPPDVVCADKRTRAMDMLHYSIDL